MKNISDLVVVFTGSKITVGHLELEFEAADIPCRTQNDYDDGVAAGRGTMTGPSAIDVYVRLEDKEKAETIVKAFKKSLDL